MSSNTVERPLHVLSRASWEKCRASPLATGVSVIRINLLAGWLLFAATLRMGIRTFGRVRLGRIIALYDSAHF
jgi:hypothetical protein